ncbi:RNase adapter RapZ [Acetobacterium wieringae]|uniref:RNase adapter RapZ n=1 Tax=Acetobacterium wieringae TaxID=52694 RepID=A0ABY6HJL5_9FIRM|nr:MULTISPECIES: RNase adapter RapZ [Acetobacterium]OXS24842.1 MAG: RNase adaptor protein RapZ [Acetobacterium sp. MES1]UYO63619.1 RNase adapter RapZ [Acetobacterium wieringae]VUZ26377.1 Nucleotide-binding protein YvcJ [Acetobacterium wieringae]
MKTIIITGMSGAGKSQAIQILEDLGYFCVDNIPPQLIVTFINLCQQSATEIEKIALVTDVRGDVFLEGKDTPLAEYKATREDLTLIFLDARDEVLVSRYQETRRNHPLTHFASNLIEAIQAERKSLEHFREIADEVIDTSDIKVRELKEQLIKLVELDRDQSKPKVKIYSFGFKYASPMGADFVFDVRFLPNPFYKQELRNLTGEDQAVRDYVMSFREAEVFYQKLWDLIEFVIPQFAKVSKNTVEIAIGCTGGQHRSVTFACLLNKALKEKGYETTLKHRDIKRNRLDH